MNPPRKPENNEGYFEYIKGGTTISSLAQNTNVTPNVADTTVGEVGDILMFTTRSTGRPFVGKRETLRAVRFNPTWPRWRGSSVAERSTVAYC